MYVMNLQEESFDDIKFGTKKYEIRLKDEECKCIKKGDFIEFQKEPLKREKIIYEVDDVLSFNNFEELIEKIEVKYLFSKEKSSINLLNFLNSFYSKEEQEKYGVVAIRLKKNSNFTIEKNIISDIKLSDKIFEDISNNYLNFSNWYLKLARRKEECYFTKKGNNISSLMILKIGENDSQQINSKNVLKIRTLNVFETNKGIGTTYLKIVDSIAVSNNIKIIYVTCKKSNKKFITFITNNNYKFYNEIDDEKIYIKELL